VLTQNGLETHSTLLAFEKVLKFTRLRKGQFSTLPCEVPWPVFGGPFGHPGIVLVEAMGHVFGESDIGPTITVFEQVNAI